MAYFLPPTLLIICLKKEAFSRTNRPFSGNLLLLANPNFCTKPCISLERQLWETLPFQRHSTATQPRFDFKKSTFFGKKVFHKPIFVRIQEISKCHICCNLVIKNFKINIMEFCYHFAKIVLLASIRKKAHATNERFSSNGGKQRELAALLIKI